MRRALPVVQALRVGRVADVNDLWPILTPIIVSVLLSLTGALAINKYAGPAQAAYVQALEGRLAVVTKERDDAESDIPHLRQRIVDLERQVDELKQDRASKDREVAELYRRLDAKVVSEMRRLDADERRLHINRPQDGDAKGGKS